MTAVDKKMIQLAPQWWTNESVGVRSLGQHRLSRRVASSMGNSGYQQTMRLLECISQVFR